MAAIPTKNWVRIPTLRGLALPALVTLIGMQSLRVYFPSLAWYLRDTVGVGSLTLGGIAIATFLLGLLSPLLRRILRPGGLLWLTAGGLAVLRLVEQLSTSPSLDLYLSLASVALFVIFLSAFTGQTRAVDGLAGPLRLAYGLWVGMALDTFLRGFTRTLDLSWTSGLGVILLVAAISGLVLWLTWREPKPHRATPADTTWSAGWPVVALGGFLLLQGLQLQNQGWVAEISGLDSGTAFAVVMLGGLALAFGAALAFSRPSLHKPIASIPIAVAIFLIAPLADGIGGFYPLTIILLQALLGWGLGVIAIGTRAPVRPGLSRTAVPMTVGLVIYLLLAFVYYVSFDVALPLAHSTVVPVAAALFGLAVIGAVGRGRSEPLPRFDLTAVVISAGLALVAIGYALVAPAVQPESPGTAASARVLTFNVHSAFSREGRLDPEAIAQVIEGSGADIVALQEMSRGWMIDSSLDLVDWLSHRLGMPIVFQATADPIWGNAILSRTGFLDHGSAPLPELDTLLHRGYLWAHVDVGGSEPLHIIATHLHHIAEEPEPRLAQIPVILEYWNGAPHTVLMGDMNAEPDWPEADLFRQAGLVDAWEQAGEGPGLTWPSDDPFQRIDWIWLSPDLVVSHAETIVSTASDHRGVFADLELP